MRQYTHSKLATVLPRALLAHCRAHSHKLPLALPHSAALPHTVAHASNNNDNNNNNNTSILKRNRARSLLAAVNICNNM
jgi:hypothetical protein